MKVNSGNKLGVWSMRWAPCLILTLWVVATSSYVWGGQSNNALIRDMELAHENNSHAVQLNLDGVVLKHIPLGMQAHIALEMCQKNGFEAHLKKINKDTKGLDFSGFDEYLYCTKTKMRWFLIGSDEYRAVIYIKNNRVGVVIGRYFFHTI